MYVSHTKVEEEEEAGLISEDTRPERMTGKTSRRRRRRRRVTAH